MRITISLILIASYFFSFCQRISFEDPDLTFSFKKPKNWEVFDDGYVVKASPSARDSADTYFTITYFEFAQPSGSFPTAKPVIESFDKGFTKTKINGIKAKCIEIKNGEYRTNEYEFVKYGQRFEIKTSARDPQINRIFRKIIRSILIKR
ncbi:hypothetical protein [Ekhidna sp.]|uniref:hypothetical protein n=1 Tax=Ekhidna sp. TaxID=2608089 RepID=UPI003297E1CC